MGDIVGDLAQARHQIGDAREHFVESERQPIEFVARTRDGQPLREIAGHDRARRTVHRVDAPQHAPRDEQRAERGEPGQKNQRDRQRAHHHRADARAIAEIVPDQQVKPARQREDARERPPAGGRSVGGFIGRVDEADVIEHPGRQLADIAGERLAGAVGQEIKRRARLARARLDRRIRAGGRRPFRIARPSRWPPPRSSASSPRRRA